MKIEYDRFYSFLKLMEEKHKIEDSLRLEDVITNARVEFVTAKYSTGREGGSPPADSLDELADALDPVIDLLSSEVNLFRLVMEEDDKGFVDPESFLRHAVRLQQAARTVHVRGSRSRPAHRGLQASVSILAVYWEDISGTEFAPHWVNGVPGNPGTGFIYDVIEFLDSTLLPSLPTATRRVGEKIRLAKNPQNSGNNSI
jgi:hypothetical protein